MHVLERVHTCWIELHPTHEEMYAMYMLLRSTKSHARFFIEDRSIDLFWKTKTNYACCSSSNPKLFRHKRYSTEDYKPIDHIPIYACRMIDMYACETVLLLSPCVTVKVVFVFKESPRWSSSSLREENQARGFFGTEQNMNAQIHHNHTLSI